MLVCCFLLTTITQVVSAQDSAVTPPKITGLVDFNGYYDSRKLNTATINVLLNLPKRFQLFTFTNYESINNTLDFSNYYSEHHLYWQLSSTSPIDLSLQVQSLSGTQNDALRAGFRWSISDTRGIEKIFNQLGLVYKLAFHLYQFDAQSNRSPLLTQIDHFYRLNLFNGKAYVTGFADQDIYYESSKFIWVTEHQLGVAVYKKLYAVAEYRYNQYLPTKNSGIGFGLEYLMLF